MLCDSAGLPLKFIVTPGEAHDSPLAVPLLEGKTGSYVLADRGYDSANIVEFIRKDMGAIPVIPSKTNRILKREHDKEIYKSRNLVERLFNRLKNFRRIATRYEKIAKNFKSLICLGCSYIWLS